MERISKTYKTDERFSFLCFTFLESFIEEFYISLFKNRIQMILYTIFHVLDVSLETV